MAMKTKVLIGLVLSILLMGGESLAAYPPEITANIVFGSKVFDLFDEDLSAEDIDLYDTWRGYVRYQQRLKPFSYWYLRYEFQSREYSIREDFNSIMHALQANFVYQLFDYWRIYLEFLIRSRDYPHRCTSSYYAISPMLQLNYYPDDNTTFTIRYRWQRRYYLNSEQNQDLQGITLSLRHKLLDNLTANLSYRVDSQQKTDEDEGGNFEHQLSVTLRWVLD